MKIIFLDVDGVLNSFNHLKSESIRLNKSLSGINYPFDPKCLINLKRIVTSTNAKLVITSTWRKYENHLIRLMEVLADYDLADEVIDTTDIIEDKETEIEAYIRNNNITTYVILDDKELPLFKEHQIKTQRLTGLTEEDSKKAIELLNKPNLARKRKTTK